MRRVAMCFSLSQFPRCRVHTLTNSWWQSFHHISRIGRGSISSKVLATGKQGLEGRFNSTENRRTLTTKSEGNGKAALSKKTTIRHEILDKTKKSDKAVDLLKKEGLKDLSTVSSTCRNVSNVIACNNSDVKEKGEGKTAGSHKIDNRKEKSLMILAQNFVKLFHCSDVDLISLDKAASALLGDVHDPMAMKTKTRRLYDIANVFVSMNLIEKIRSPDNGKPVFRWIAWKENLRTGSLVSAKSDDSTRRTFGAEITNTTPKRYRDDSSSDVMSNGQVKRLKVSKDDELKDKKQEISTEQLNERGTKDFVFGPFGPSSLPRSGISGKENLKQIQNWEDLASKYHPQYQNKAANELFAHYVEAWESWQVEAANELHKQHEH